MYIIVSASPNADGLTAASAKAVYQGVIDAGGTAEIIDISSAKLEPCRICGDGWGSCRSGNCVIDIDIFAGLKEKIKDSEGLVLVTPVYWWQPSERMRYFLDRFRRCEAFKGKDGAAYGKIVHLVAAAGGSGNGTAQCLNEMEQWCRHVGAIPTDRVGITRFTRESALATLKDMGARFVKGEYFKRS